VSPFSVLPQGIGDRGLCWGPDRGQGGQGAVAGMTYGMVWWYGGMVVWWYGGRYEGMLVCRMLVCWYGVWGRYSRYQVLYSERLI
jgi:hypothetical protein